MMWGDRIHINFTPTFVCNFNCPYCIVNQVQYYKKYKKEHGGKEWLNVFDKYFDKPLLISMSSAGEPFLWKGMKEFLLNISNLHYVQLSSNMSWDIDEFIDALKSCRANFTLKGSYHPYGIDIDIFIEKLKRLQNEGLKIMAGIVAYPPKLSEIPEIVERFKREKIPFGVESYINPNSKYTKEQNEIIRKYIKNRPPDIMEFDQNPSLKTCKAGQFYIFLISNGDVYTCAAGFYYVTSPLHKKFRAKKEEFYMGNVFDGTFKVKEKDIICKYPCSEYCDLEHAQVKFSNKVIS